MAESGYELLADEADDEVVVVLVEAVARQADVVREVGGAVRHADRAVLGENHALLLGRQLREPAAAPERIPDGPAPVRIEHRPPRPVQQHVDQIRLVADRVGAAEHRVLRLLRQRRRTAALIQAAAARDRRRSRGLR